LGAARRQVMRIVPQSARLLRYICERTTPTAYMLAFASLLLPVGALADRFGRKKLLIIGLTVFTLASFACGSAPTLTVLIAARALQGEGAGIFTDEVKPEFREFIKSFRPVQRLGTMEDVANAAEYLAGDLSAFLSGQHLLVSGGAPA
jgi:MFS family permease